MKKTRVQQPKRQDYHFLFHNRLITVRATTESSAHIKARKLIVCPARG